MVIHFKSRVNDFKFKFSNSHYIIQDLSLSTLFYNKDNFNVNISIFLSNQHGKYASKLLI